MMLRLITCVALVTTVLAGWATCQEAAPNLSATEKRQALLEIDRPCQYGVYIPGCRLTTIQLGTFKKLREAVVEAQKNKTQGAYVVVGDQKRVGDIDSSDKVKLYMVGASLRCGSPFVTAKYASTTAARAAMEKHPHEVLVVDVGDSSPVDTLTR